MITAADLTDFELLKAAFPDCRTLDRFINRAGNDMKHLYTAFEMLRKSYEVKTKKETENAGDWKLYN